MKKLTFFAMVLMLVAVFAVNAADGAPAQAASDSSYTDTSTYKFVKEFSETYKSRSAGTETERAAGDYIAETIGEIFTQNGITASGSGVKGTVAKQNIGAYYQIDSFNVVAKLDVSRSEQQIIIGAHYDSVVSGEGAADNASGVAALIRIVSELSAAKDRLPCDVVFAAFCAEEAGLWGSSYFTGVMPQTEKDRTLMMINIDSVGGGDNLYLHCENKRTDMHDMFAKAAENGPSALYRKPFAKGTVYGLADFYGFGYYETIQGADSTSFRVAGIPTAFFFSGNYNAAFWNYAESADASFNVMNTASDTFANLDRRGEEFVNKIETVVTSVSGAVLSDGFMSTAENARGQLVNLNFWYSRWWPLLAAAVIIAAAAVIAATHYRKLQKRSIMGTAEVKSKKVFESPDADDIFTFKDK